MFFFSWVAVDQHDGSTTAIFFVFLLGVAVHQHDVEPQRVRHHGGGVRGAWQRRSRRSGPAPPEDEELHH